MEFSDLRKGAIILFQLQPHEIMWSQFMRMQQRKPVMQVKMRNLETQKVVEYSFKSGERVDEADISKRKAQYLYADAGGANFMTQDTFETITLPPELASGKVGYLKEGAEVTIQFFGEKAINIELPIKVDLVVKSTPPGIRGDTATGGTKSATLETGIVVNVPLFIKEGEMVKINTDTGEYVERAN